MWAQLIRTRLKDGHEDAVERLMEQFRAIEQPRSGLIRSLAMRDQNDSSAVYMLVVFESEEKARARESDPAREGQLGTARAIMAEAFEGAPQFTDLVVLADFTP
jgi:quinol monooxygenase YgiN